VIEVDYTKESEPSTRGEKITYYVFLSLMFIGFSLEVFTNFEPGKLAAIVFLLAWIPLTVLHELGHALAAKLVGWQVEEFVIGYGKIVKEFRYHETKVEFRTLPIGGYILPKSTPENWGRFKSAFVYFAGPGIELIVFFSIYSFIGFDNLMNPGGSTFHFILQGIGISAVTGAVLNLIPFSALTEKGETPNDGLGILLSLFGRRG